MNPLIKISLVGGWLPTTVWVLGLASLIFLILRLRRGWALRVLISAVLSAVLVFGIHWLLVYAFSLLGEPMPNSVIAWAGLGIFAVLIGGWAMKGSKTLRRALTPIAVVCALLLCGLQINAYFGQYVNLGTLLGASDVNLPTLPSQYAKGMQSSAAPAGQPAVTRWRAPAGLPSRGKLFQAQIPGTSSGFHARAAIVYLPPAYEAAHRPLLPVLVLVAGQPGGPQRWVDAGDLAPIMNAFAKDHDGLAPVTVVVDATGSTSANTMCMDSKIAQAGTYLSKDVPAWIKANLNVQPDNSRWAFGGFSFGGTCAIQMGTMYPRTYPNIIDLSGQLEPEISANKSTTINASFGSDTAGFEAVLPMTLLQEKTYPHSAAYFSVGVNDSHYGPDMAVMAAAAKASGMHVKDVQVPGKAHSWSSARIGLRGGLDFLAKRLGLVP
ncbi:alpha/beta hydrolase [Paeniglutamicibacter cryotolerans]|uniref:S-formylglutathione hydrolase FrmB n=1 Tax=Paeniglutamicibacter cryotolerans TaxID=670079 RepID=A0A839QF28_9MICC|nr:alpha/beta hydrolase-fold protein [Paeniglutamicibacter cryotolerans]MBB2994247.1 S-formylglutathione hydrolase FrmB [Paeniglutamicibacter cryotolerans]